MLWTAIGCLVPVLAWLLAGRHVALLATSLPTTPMRYDGGLRIAGMSMTFGGTDNLRKDVYVRSDTGGRAYLCWAGVTFPLGTRTNPVDPRGRVDIDFVPDLGDEIRFTARKSMVWPNPFEVRWLGGPAPRWKQYVFYRLVWKKRSGARLEMNWRYQKEHYANKGWTEPLMMWNSKTGLLSVEIER
jgi:hypothetical protein